VAAMKVIICIVVLLCAILISSCILWPGYQGGNNHSADDDATDDDIGDDEFVDDVTDDDTGDDDTADDDTADDDTIDDDTADMVLVPAGNFWMGCEPEDTQCNSGEYPRHQVYLSAYYIDVYEVTNDRYAEFLNDHGNVCDDHPCAYSTHDYSDLGMYELGETWLVDSGYENRPVIFVTWFGAKDFCEWTGGRLPSEAEWEKAAKGDAEHYIYPWGDAWIDNAANYWDSGDPYETGSFPWTTPVGYYDGSNHGGAYQTTDGRSPYCAHDMAGNVYEWVNDWYSDTYYSTSPTTDPPGPAAGTSRVLRGGSWAVLPWNVRASSRAGDIPTGRVNYFGFRCSRD